MRQKESCDFVLYVITKEMKGVYSIAEVVDDSNKRPQKTIFCCLIKEEDEGFDKAQIKSLQATTNLVKNNGAKVCTTLEGVVEYLNSQQVKIAEENVLSGSNIQEVIAQIEQPSESCLPWNCCGNRN